MFNDKVVVVLLGTIDEGILGAKMVLECEGYKTVSLHMRLTELFIKTFCFDYNSAEKYAKKILKEFNEKDITNYLESLKLPNKSLIITDNYELASKCKSHLGAKVYRCAVLGKTSSIPINSALYDKIIAPDGVRSSKDEVV